ncbi:probable inactive receptor kinase [Tanacetum coccineum]
MDIDNASEDQSVLIADVIIVGLFVGEDAAVANRKYEFDGVYNTEWDGGSDCPVVAAGGCLWVARERCTELQEICVEKPNLPTLPTLPSLPILPMGDSIPSPSRAIFPSDYLSRRPYRNGFTRAIPMADGANFENGGGSCVPVLPGSDEDKLVVVGNHFFKITVGDLLRAYFVTLGSGKSVYKCVVESKLLVSTLKNLLSVTLSVPEFRDRINRLEGMDHPHLLPIRAYCYDEYDKFILYDYAPSGSLFDLLYVDRRLLTIGDTLTIALGVAEGIKHLHTHAISHGNFKSSNVIVTSGLHVHLLALGLRSTSHSFTAYRAPESRRIDLVEWVKLKVEEVGNASFSKVRPENAVEQRQIEDLLMLAADCIDEPSERPTMFDVTRRIAQLQVELF